MEGIILREASVKYGALGGQKIRDMEVRKDKIVKKQRLTILKNDL